MEPQLLANILLSFSILGPVTLGFSLIYSVCRYFHFAHGIIYTFGAYLALFVTLRWSNATLSLLMASVVSAALGLAVYLSIYRKLERRSASSLGFLVASIGVYVVIQNVVGAVMGEGGVSAYNRDVRQGEDYFGAAVTTTQLEVMAVSVGALLMTFWTLHFRRIGFWFRAVADERELAASLGIPVTAVTMWAFAVGSGLAGLAGGLTVRDTQITPQIGLSVLLAAVTAAITGGLRSQLGSLVGALAVSTLQQLSIFFFGGRTRDAVVFATLALVMWLRPQGFLGLNDRSWSR